MKKFDFNDPRFKQHCAEKQEFLERYHDHPITIEAYVRALQNMPKHEHWSQGHSPSNARHQYRRLVKNYGFFMGGGDER